MFLNFYDKLARFEKLMEKNTKAKTNAIHISLNFETSETLSKDKLKLIAEAYMKKIGFDGQPFLVYEHKDAAHPHIHIVSTNIKHTGERINLHNIGREASTEARKEIETEFNLIKAEGRGKKHIDDLKPIPLEKAVYGKSETKRAISNIVREVVRSYKYTSLAELNAVLGCFNVIAFEGKEGSLMKKKKGLCYSIINDKGEKLGVPIKSSSIYGRPTLPFLENQFQINKMLRKTSRSSLINRIDPVLQLSDPLSKNTFKAMLAKEKIAVVFRENKQSITYGVTYVDHKTKSVFNGSDFGKEYSAGMLTKRFSASQDDVNFETGKTNYRTLPEKIEKAFPLSSSIPCDHHQINPSHQCEMEAPLQDLINAKENQAGFVPSELVRKKMKKRGRSL